MEIKSKTSKVSNKAKMPQLENGTTNEKIGNENQREQKSCREKMGSTEKQMDLKL